MQQQVLLQKKLLIQGEQVCFLQHNEGKKIFASKKIWFGNSRTNVFLGQNILFRLRIICTCCLYNKHACRKLDWSTSFKIHIRCQVFDKIPVWFWFFFFENSNFILYPMCNGNFSSWDEILKTFPQIGKISFYNNNKKTLKGPENKWVHYFCIKSLKRKPASYPRSKNAEVWK